jgi:hypothetical protein
MSNVEVVTQTPSVRAARVVYFTNLTNRSAPVIPLGVFAEIMLPKIHGLALMARSSLSPTERGMIGALMRDRLADPFSFLRDEFEEAWDKAEPGKALDFLATRHTAALSVLAPHEVAIGGFWLKLFGSNKVEVKLSSAIDQELDELLRQDHTNQPMPKRKLIEVIAA